MAEPGDPLPLSMPAELLVHCLAAGDAGSQAAMHRFCAEHPGHSGVLRRLYAALEQFGLIEDPIGDTEGRERIGPYRLLSVLGSGGMGIVYLAEQEPLGRKVALKLIQPGHAAPPRARQRFQREVQALSLIDHPNICPVYDAGEVDGVPYLAMRHVPGETLAQRIERGRQAAGQRAPSSSSQRGAIDPLLQLGEKVARALHAAHEKGLVHRDVKPGNVLIDSATCEPLLLDFGLARLDDGDTPNLTVSGDRVGTPAYMAPEQVTGLAVDRRTDVYALAATLYEALTLRPPYQAPTREALYRKILAGDLSRVSRHNRGVPRDLETVLQTALDRDPNRRYRTAKDFADDLERVRLRQPIAARRPGLLLRAWLFGQRKPLAAAFIGFLVVALLGAVVLLQERGAALQTARAVKLARESELVGAEAPQLGLHLALEAVGEDQDNLETRSQLYAAVARSHERLRLVGHGGSVWGVAFSPVDGKRILTWSDDKTARLWDLEGNEIARMPHEKAVQWAEFAPDGGIATASYDGRARIWDAEGHLLHPLDLRPLVTPSWSNTLEVTRAAFSPDGTRVLTCTERTCHVWDRATGERIGPPFRGHRGLLLWGAAWSPVDPDLVATAVDYGEARPDVGSFEVLIWRPSTGQVVAEITEHTDSVSWVEFAPDGRSVLTASSDGTARLFDLDGTQTAEMDGHPGRVWRARFAPDGNHIVTACEDGGVRLWNRRGDLLAMERRHEDAVFDARFVRTTDGPRILTAGWDNTARLLDVDLQQGDLRERLVLRGHGQRLFSAAVTPGGDMVATASWDKTVRLWSLGYARLPLLQHHRAPVMALAQGRDRLLVSVSRDGVLALTDLEDLSRREFRIQPRPESLQLDSDGTRALVGHQDAVVRLYNLRDGTELARFELDRSPGCTAVFVDEGRIVTAGRAGQLRIWSTDGKPLGNLGERHGDRVIDLDVATAAGLLAAGGWQNKVRITPLDRTRAWEWPAHPHWINALAFSPRADRIATASSDQTARIWNLRGEPLSPPLRGHDGDVLAVAWSPDGALLATGGQDGTARLWRAADGEALPVLCGHVGAIRSVLFTPDGRLWTAGDDGDIRAWPVDLAELLAIAEDRKVRELTPEEQERFDRHR